MTMVYVKVLNCGQAVVQKWVRAIIYVTLVLAEQLGSNHAQLGSTPSFFEFFKKIKTSIKYNLLRLRLLLKKIYLLL